MKHKYISLQVMPGCLSTKASKKNIYLQLEETIAERKKIMKLPEDFSGKAKVIDIYRGANKAA